MIRKKKASGQMIDMKKIQAVWGPVALATLAVFVLRVLYVQLLHPYGLAPDEAQYWSWLAQNDLSFMTKPPLTTWLIGVSCAVFGKTLLGVKFFALAGQAATAVLGYALAKEIAGNKAAWWAWVLLTTAPLLAAGGLIMSPDAVLVPLWLGAWLSVIRALNTTDDKALCWGRWVMIGVLIGLGGLAKYSAAFFYPLLGVYLLVWKREWLLRPQVWGSGAIALAFQLPVLIWNMQHDWMGIAHVLWQADGGGDERHGGIKSVLEYLGSQAGVLGPVAFGFMVYGLWVLARNKDARGRMLVVAAGGILAMFLGLAFFSKVQANWPVLGSVVGLVLAGIAIGSVQRRWVVYVAVFGVVLNSVLSLMLMDTYKARDLKILPLKAKIDPTKELRGWADLGNLLGVMMYKLDNPVILSSRYQTLAPLMFHTVGNPEFAYINAEGKRGNEYDLWPLPNLSDRLVVYVNEQGYLPPKIKGMFSQCEPWHTIGTEEYGIQTRRLSTWICWNGQVAG